MRPLGIEYISVFGLPPPDFVRLAADLGCQHIGLGLEPVPDERPFHAPWSLRRDAALRRETKAALAEHGVSISLGEGLLVFAEKDVGDYGGDLEVMAELGVTRINTLSFDPDPERTLQQFGALADMAAPLGMELTIEFTPSKAIATLPDGRATLARLARPNLRLLVDTMHFCRGGSQVADLAATPAQEIGYVQLCDSAAAGRSPTYSQEAIAERLPPGQGKLPLRDILAALPRDRIVSLEVPQRSLAEAGASHHDRLRPCVEAARRMLAEIDAD